MICIYIFEKFYSVQIHCILDPLIRFRLVLQLRSRSDLDLIILAILINTRNQIEIEMQPKLKKKCKILNFSKLTFRSFLVFTTNFLTFCYEYHVIIHQLE